MTLSKDRLPQIQDEDRRGNFLTDAAIHLVNENSIRDLKKTIENKYKYFKNKTELVNAEVNIFRPTFLIDEENDAAYCEEEFQEVRIANVLFRHVGPCQRC